MLPKDEKFLLTINFFDSYLARDPVNINCFVLEQTYRRD